MFCLALQSLVQFVKERSSEVGLQSTRIGSRLGTEPRGILEEVKSQRWGPTEEK